MLSIDSKDIINVLEEIRPLSPVKKLQALIEKPNCRGIIQALPVQDLLMLIKEIGPGDCLEIMELMSPGQVQQLIDLDGWKRYRIDPVKMGAWLETFFSANPHKSLQQFLGLDTELISLFYKVYAHILDTNTGEEPGDLTGLYSISPDRRFYVIFDTKEENAPLVRFLHQALEALYRRHLPLALGILEATRWEMPSLLEEEALRFRNGRLQDLGFPPLEEALAVLAPATLPADAWERKKEAPLNTIPEGLTLLDGNFASFPTLQQALAACSPEDKTHFLSTTAWLFNCVHLAFGGELGEPESLRESVHYSLSVIEMGLCEAAKESQQNPAFYVTHFSAQQLFKAGRVKIFDFQTLFKKIVHNPNNGLTGKLFNLLDSPYLEAAKGFLKKEPLFYKGLLGAESLTYKRFETIHELMLAHAAVLDMAKRAAFCGPKGLRMTEASLADLGYEDPAAYPSHATLIGTFLCRQLLSLPGTLASLSQEDCLSLFPLLKTHTTEELAHKASPFAESLPPSYVKQIFQHIKEELLALENASSGSLDGRLVSALLISNSSSPLVS